MLEYTTNLLISRQLPPSPTRAFEIGAGFLKSGLRAALMFTLLRARKEAAAPLPSIGVMRIADALNNRARVDIAVIDLPVGRFRIGGG